MCPQRRAARPNGEWGYSTRRHMLEPVRTEAVLPDRAVCLPTFSHCLIVNKLLFLPPRRTGEYWKGMIRARPLCFVPGGQGIGLGEWVGDWGGPETVWALLCVAERRATRPNGKWGSRRHMLGPERPEAVSPERGVVLTDLQ